MKIAKVMPRSVCNQRLLFICGSNRPKLWFHDCRMVYCVEHKRHSFLIYRRQSPQKGICSTITSAAELENGSSYPAACQALPNYEFPSHLSKYFNQNSIDTEESSK